MRSAVPALVLAALAAAAPPPPGRPALRLRSAIDALPVEARAELRALYLRYVDAVGRRLEQGWIPGALSDEMIEGSDEPFLPARLLDQRLHALKAAAARGERGAYRKLDDLRRRHSRAKGVCKDWSDDIWAELTAASPKHWTVEDRERSARPLHAAAVACASADPRVCLAFDPWEDGEPAVAAFDAWDAREPGGRLPANYFLNALPKAAR